MMIVSDDIVKRTFQQMHAMFLQAVTPTPSAHALGAAISFITTTVVLSQQLKTEGRLSTTVENDQKQTISNWVSQQHLTVTQRVFINADANDQAVCDLRHVRNCFGHGNWRYDVNAVSGASMPIVLEDWQQNRKTQQWEQTWAATIDMVDLINLAQRLLVVTFNGMP